MLKHAFSEPSMIAGEVEKVSGLSTKDFLNEYVARKKPVIITDLAKRWPRMAEMTPDYFRKHHGNFKYTINGKVFTLSEYLDLMPSSTYEHPIPYPFKINVDRDMPELAKHFLPSIPFGLTDRIYNPLIPGRFKGGTTPNELFFGGQGSFYPVLHFDVLHMNTQITQVMGDKEFFMFPPEQTEYLYADPEDPFSSVIDNPVNPDFNKYPAYRKARAWKAMVKEGETLFFPYGWWHFTVIHNPCITFGRAHLNSINWSLFMADNYKAFGKRHKFLAFGANQYLNVLGKMLDAYEGVKRGFISNSQSLAG
jgi:hypothetical protein